MKKNFVYALMSAIALTGAVSFSSCSSSDDSAEANPNFNPQTNEVLAQFIFNVATGNTPTTRQSAVATQALPTSAFRGIDDSHIMCFKQAGHTGDWMPAPTTVDRDYPMHAVAAAGTMSSDKSARVLEMSLPLQTNTIVFYGRAPKDEDGNAYGKLLNDDGTDGYNIAANMTDVDMNTISFHLGRRLTSGNKTKFQETQNLLAGVLTCIMNVGRWTNPVDATQCPEGVPNPYKYDIPAAPELTWASYVKGANSPISHSKMDPLEEKMAKAYFEMTHIKENELRNASGPAILAMIEDLWTIVNAVRYANPISVAEATAKYMAELVNQELDEYFHANVLNGDGSQVTIGYIRTPQVIVPKLVADTNWPSGDGVPSRPISDNFTHISGITDGDYLNKFPDYYDLPQGATHVKFENKAFKYVVDFSTSAVGSSGGFTVDDYYYPPELLYFGNSPIRVSNAEHLDTQYPQKTTTWDTEDQWPTTGDKTWTTPGAVESTTRSVAMKYDINYGTALLQTTVGYTAEVRGGTTLKDNNAKIQHDDYGATENNQEIEAADGLFSLVGILVGGQSPKVGWNFLPLPLGAGEHSGYVYDKVITNNGYIPKTGSDPNYTLVFDNYKAPATPGGAEVDQDKVYIALEFKNNGPNFFGADNLITNGSNFYLIGVLDPTGRSIAEDKWPTWHALPPYTNGSTMNKVTRVFIQDYMTTANFKIGEFSLQYAYLTVPDLRASSVTLGLSVDLSWSTGLVFDDLVIGGNTQTPITNP